MRCMIFSRATGGMLRQRPSSNAVRAAAIARSISLSVASTNLEMTLPEDGSSTSIVASPELSTHSPLMKSCGLRPSAFFTAAEYSSWVRLMVVTSFMAAGSFPEANPCLTRL